MVDHEVLWSLCDTAKARVLASYRFGIGESTSKGEFRFGTMWGRNDYHPPATLLSLGRLWPDTVLACYGISSGRVIG